MPTRRKKYGIGCVAKRKKKAISTSEMHNANPELREQTYQHAEQQAQHCEEQAAIGAHIDELLLEGQNIEPLFDGKSRCVAIGWMF